MSGLPTIVAFLAWLGAVALPWVLAAAGEEYYLGLATRILAYALAAIGLNFATGIGGMVAFGHAAFFGGAAYLLALFADAGWHNAWIVWPLTLLAIVGLALLLGMLSLATQGIHFIMITLAFAQMLYYAVLAWPAAGGEDGLLLPSRSLLPPFDLADDRQLYWLALAAFTAVFLALRRLAVSPYGRALLAAKENATRLVALGYPFRRLQLAAFALSAAIAGLGGLFLANQNGMASPALLSWTTSGVLLVMALIGGIHRLWGGLVGAIIWLCAEEWLGRLSEHPHFFLGLLLLAIALIAPPRRARPSTIPTR